MVGALAFDGDITEGEREGAILLAVAPVSGLHRDRKDILEGRSLTRNGEFATLEGQRGRASPDNRGPYRTDPRLLEAKNLAHGEFDFLAVETFLPAS